MALAVSAMTKSPPDMAGLSKTLSTKRPIRPSANTASGSAVRATAWRFPFSGTLAFLLVDPTKNSIRSLHRPDRLHRIDRQPDRRKCALARLALDRHAPAMQAGKALDHREAEAGPLILPRIDRLGLHERRAEP